MPNPPRKYIFTPERQAYLREHYGRTPAKDIARHALFCGVPTWRIWHWAGDLELTGGAKPWTKREEAYLETHYHHMSSSELAQRLGRSQSGIINKCRQIGLCKTTQGYTLQDVAMGLGCSEGLLLKWIEAGWLVASKRVMGRTDDRAAWYISEQAIRTLVRCHPNQINQHRVDWLWLMDVIFDGIGDLRGERN